MNQNEKPSALSGIRVLEFGTLLAGPLCARILADFGAEVIKVEEPGAGDPLRRWGPELFQGRDVLWTIYGRNKRCVTLNLREPEGQELARQLLRDSDILVENFRPGTMEKWGLGPEDLSGINPRLIMVRVSGFGQTGPYSSKAGFGSVAEAMGGIRYVTGHPDRPPARIGVSLGDSLAALFGVIGALIALYNRDNQLGGEANRTGQVVDVAIYEAVFALMESLVPDYVLQGKIRERSGTVLPHVAPSNIFPCRDGVDVIIAANADNVFVRLCSAMGQTDLAQDPRFATHMSRGEHQEEIDAIVAEWTSQRKSQEVMRIMDGAGVPCGPIYTAREIVNDPHFNARQMILSAVTQDGLEFPMPGIVPRLAGTPGSVRWPGPIQPGIHNYEVYGEILGLSKPDVDSLAKRGII